MNICLLQKCLKSGILCVREMMRKMRCDVNIELNEGKPIKIRYAHENITPDTYFDRLHKHSCCEICIPISGDMIHTANGKSYSLKRGDVFFCRPGDLHYGSCHAESLYERYALWIPRSIFSELRVDALAFLDFESLQNHNVFRIRKARRDIFFSMLEALKPSLMSGNSANKLALYGKVAEILAFLSSEAKAYVKEYAADIERSAPPALVNRAMLCIRDNFAHLNGVNEIAEKLHINRDHLSRLFKKHTEMTIHEYLLNVRIHESKMMLLKGCGVTETAFSCGFNSTSYFIKVFFEHTGKTPNEFKKSRALLISEAE